MYIWKRFLNKYPERSSEKLSADGRQLDLRSWCGERSKRIVWARVAGARLNLHVLMCDYCVVSCVKIRCLTYNCCENLKNLKIEKVQICFFIRILVQGVTWKYKADLALPQFSSIDLLPNATGLQHLQSVSMNGSTKRASACDSQLPLHTVLGTGCSERHSPTTIVSLIFLRAHSSLGLQTGQHFPSTYSSVPWKKYESEFFQSSVLELA